jgi:DNA-binding transcriptional LysR family regulator
MPPRRTQLGYLVTVVEEGQISRAAQKLQLSQPALSHAIAQLESEVGVELLERRPRGVMLTPAGAAFLDKARAAFVAETEAAQTAAALGRAAQGTLLVGFIGSPPAVSFPELFGAFAAHEEGSKVSFQDLPFPRGTTTSWLAGVDVAVCLPPAPEHGVSALALRVEPRGVAMAGSHPLARREELSLEDVLDETFIGYHPEVQPGWTAFHSLDDHRGGPPRAVTGDRVTTTLQMAAIIASSQAITTAPHGDLKLAQLALTTIAAMPLGDAAPAAVSLVWRTDNDNPLLAALLDAAAGLAPPSDGV